MKIYFIIGILALWLIYQLLIKFLGKARIGYSIIVTFVFILGFCYFIIYDMFDSLYYEYYYYGTIGFFTMYLLISNLRKLLKKSVSEYDIYALEKDLDELNLATELLRKRFVSTIELLRQGISFRESDGTVFGSDRYIEIIGFNNNEFTNVDFEKLMFKDDLPQYRNAIEKTTKKTPVYHVSYRIKKDNEMMWIKESGKRIVIDKKVTYISLINALDIKQYPESEVEVLNSLKNEKKMYNEMQKLSRTKVPYHLIKIRLTNIPKINEKYGRDVGDLMMGEYIKKLRYNFIKDNQSLFRNGGIDFGIIIKEEKKYDFLKRALSGDGELLNLKMVFGGITQTLYPNLGIAESPYESKSPDVVLEEAKEALRISLLDQTNKNYCFYDEI